MKKNIQYDMFSLSDMINIVDVDRDRMNEWVSRGYLTSTREIQKGSRKHQKYSRLDIISCAVFKYLIEKLELPRVTASKISKMIKHTMFLYMFEEVVFIDLSTENPVYLFGKNIINDILCFEFACDENMQELKNENDEFFKYDIALSININKIINEIDNKIDMLELKNFEHITKSKI